MKTGDLTLALLNVLQFPPRNLHVGQEHDQLSATHLCLFKQAKTASSVEIHMRCSQLDVGCPQIEAHRCSAYTPACMCKPECHLMQSFHARQGPNCCQKRHSAKRSCQAKACNRTCLKNSLPSGPSYQDFCRCSVPAAACLPLGLPQTHARHPQALSTHMARLCRCEQPALPCSATAISIDVSANDARLLLNLCLKLLRD